MRVVSLLFHDVFVGDPGESGFSSPAADRYKLSVGEFEQQLSVLHRSHLTPRSSSTHSSHSVRLTFDDGGASYYTIVADRLEQLGWRGYCFVPTDFIGRTGFLSAAQIRELDARGHLIGTHSASHPARFSALSRVEMRCEWADSRKALEDVLGRPVTTGSVPGGYFSRAVARAAADAGLQRLFNSEPVRSTRPIDGCTVAGRFAIRRGAAPDFSRKLVHRAPWTRWCACAAWRTKGLFKPLLGDSYPRVADWIQSRV